MCRADGDLKGFRIFLQIGAGCLKPPDWLNANKAQNLHGHPVSSSLYVYTIE